jgi:hypothetical protein
MGTSSVLCSLVFTLKAAISSRLIRPGAFSLAALFLGIPVCLPASGTDRISDRARSASASGGACRRASFGNPERRCPPGRCTRAGPWPGRRREAAPAFPRVAAYSGAGSQPSEPDRPPAAAWCARISSVADPGRIWRPFWRFAPGYCHAHNVAGIAWLSDSQRAEQCRHD